MCLYRLRGCPIAVVHRVGDIGTRVRVDCWCGDDWCEGWAGLAYAEGKGRPCSAGASCRTLCRHLHGYMDENYADRDDSVGGLRWAT
jgi:hypothetical protein